MSPDSSSGDDLKDYLNSRISGSKDDASSIDDKKVVSDHSVEGDGKASVSVLETINSEASRIILTTQTTNFDIVKRNLEKFYSEATCVLVSSKNLKAYDSSNMAYFDFYSLLINPTQSYRDFLNYADLPDDWADCECVGFKVLKTKNNSVWVPEVKRYNKKSAYGKYISTKNSSVRLAVSLNQFASHYQMVERYVEGEVTLPLHISLALSLDPKEAIQKIDSAFKLWINFLKQKYGGELGLVYNIHPWSTKDLTPHFHVHFNILCAIRKDDVFYEFDPWIDGEGFESLRLEWQKCCKKVGIEFEELPVVHWRYEFIGNRSKLIHRLKYCSRSPLIDVASYYKEKSFDKDFSKDWCNVLATYCNRRRYLGYMRRLKHYVKIEKESDSYSPLNGELVKEVKHVLSVDLSSALASGDLLLIEWDHSIKKYKVWRSESYQKKIQPKELDSEVRAILHSAYEMLQNHEIRFSDYHSLVHDMIGINEKNEF